MIEPARLEERVRQFASESVPSLRVDRGAVLAASGGGDSTAMIALLCESAIVEPARCVVAHFDHRLRGDAAAEDDRRAVAAVCSRFGLRLVEGSWESPRRGEAAAREARYAFLARTCRTADLGTVVTGHTADDQVETVLMNVMRGAGVYGLAGMSGEGNVPVRARCAEADRLTLARPLLCLGRDETRAYCEQRGLAFSDDESNEDERVLRNRVRQQLLPAIERRWPEARERLLAMSLRAREAVGVLDALSAAAVVDCRQDRVVLSRRELRDLAPSASVHAFRLAVVQLLGDVREFGRPHYEMMQAAVEARAGTTFRLPRAVELVVDAETLVVSVGPVCATALAVGFERQLPFRGRVGSWWIEVMPRASECARASLEAATIDLRLPGDAVLRGWRPGDRVQPAGMRGHKKLQDYYVDRKLPRRERQAAPVIACGREVAWTPFGPVAALPAGADGAEWTVRWHRVEGEEARCCRESWKHGILRRPAKSLTSFDARR